MTQKKESENEEVSRVPDYTKFKPRKEVKGKKEVRETVFSFPFTEEEQLKKYLKRAAGIVIPDVQVCEGHSTPWRAVCDAYFARSPVSVWKGCIPDDGIVQTIHGPVQMVDVEIGEQVLGWNGSKTEWSDVLGKRLSGDQEVFCIKTNSSDLRVTAKHRVLIFKKIKTPRKGKGGYKAIGWTPCWVECKDLVVGDFLVQPFGYVDDDGMKPTLEREAELIGLLIGDGGCSKHKVWVAHHKNATYMDHYRRTCFDLFGKNLHYNDSTNTSFLFSTWASDRLKSLGVVGNAYTKRIPRWIWSATVSEKLAFLRGYLDADGSVKEKGEVEWSSISRMLLEDVRALCISLGLSAGRITKRNCHGKYIIMDRTVIRHDIYTLRCYHYEFGTNDSKYKANTLRRRQKGTFDQRWHSPDNVESVRFLKILKIKNEGIKRTWDIEVSGTESFTCDTFIVHNSRGLSGKTFTIGALGFAEVTTLGASVNVLGGSGEQSRRVHDALNRFWGYESAPRYLLKGQPLQRETNLTNGGQIRALLASQASVRGPHVARLRVDECDEIEWEILEAALGQPQSQRGVKSQTVLSSTHQYENGTMARLLSMAKEKKWSVHEWCLRESMHPHGWLSQEEADRKKDMMTDQSWRIEVELQRPNAESRAIRTEAVQKMFDESLGHFRGDEGEYIEIEKPDPNGVYVHGADWARSKDWTIVVTVRVDCEPMKVVAFQKAGRRDWPEMTSLLDERQRRFGGHARHDGTGLGDVINSFLLVPATGVWLSGHTRQQIFSNYIMAIEAGNIVCPKIDCMLLEHERCVSNDLYGSGHPPDTFVATALAVSCLQGVVSEVTW